MSPELCMHLGINLLVGILMFCIGVLAGYKLHSLHGEDMDYPEDLEESSGKKKYYDYF